VALQQTTRQLWASQGPFKPYTVHRVPQQNVPEDYIKAVVWRTDVTPNRYHAQSSAPEESGIPSWYPVEFNPEHICWVDVTDLQGPPSERTQTEKLRDLKKLAQHYARDRGSCDNVQISYLESLEEHDNDNLRLAQMVAG
jgi:hypothetical protein